MNLPNKLTISRIFIAIIILVMLCIPWHALGFTWPVYLFKGVTFNLKYIIAGILFLIASLTDKLDGYIARKYNMITGFGKMADAIADKILVNGVLIILAYDRIIPVVIPVIIITRDIITDTCKMMSGNKGKVVAASSLGKIKTAFMMVGLTLTLFNNFPFEFIHFPFANLCLIIATIFSVVSGCQYYYKTREFIIPKEDKKSTK